MGYAHTRLLRDRGLVRLRAFYRLNHKTLELYVCVRCGFFVKGLAVLLRPHQEASTETSLSDHRHAIGYACGGASGVGGGVGSVVGGAADGVQYLGGNAV